MFQSEEPWPCWKMKTTIPNAAASETQVEDHRLDRQHDRAERPREQDQRQDQDEGEHVGEAAVEGVHEVAVDRGDAGERAVRALERGVGAVDDSSGCRGRRRRSPGTPRPASRVRDARPRGAVAPTTPGTVRSFAAIGCGVAAVLDEHVERLHHAGADPGGGELSRGRRSPCRCRGSSSAAPRSGSAASPGRRARRRSPGRRSRPARAAAARSAPSGPRRRPRGGRGRRSRFGITRTLLIRVPSIGEHRRQQRDRREHRDDRDQHAADPDRADERQRQHDHRQQADRHRRAGDDHRAAGVGHRLDQRRSRRRCPRAARRGSGRSSAARSRSRRRARPARSGTGR